MGTKLGANCIFQRLFRSREVVCAQEATMTQRV